MDCGVRFPTWLQKIQNLIFNHKIMKDGIFTIKLDWWQHNPDNSERVGAMYCFKRCDVRQN